MENAKDKMTPIQIVAVVFSMILICAAFLFGALILAGVFNVEDIEILKDVFWIAIALAQLLIACANWNKQKVMSTVNIGIWSFFLGGFVFMLLSVIMK